MLALPSSLGRGRDYHHSVQVGTFAKWREGKCNASRTFFLHPLKKVYIASRFMSYANALRNDERNVMKRLLLVSRFETAAEVSAYHHAQ